MDWIPVAFIVFKAVLFITCMFLAIKWHYEQDKKKKILDARKLLGTGGKFLLVFIVLLAILLFITFTLASKIGLDVSMP